MRYYKRHIVLLSLLIIIIGSAAQVSASIDPAINSQMKSILSTVQNATIQNSYQIPTNHTYFYAAMNASAYKKISGAGFSKFLNEIVSGSASRKNRPDASQAFRPCGVYSPKASALAHSAQITSGSSADAIEVYNCPFQKANYTGAASASGKKNQQYSYNWGGYVVASSFANPQPEVTSVNDSWIVQNATPSEGAAQQNA